MNTPKPDLEELLDDLIPTSTKRIGPNRSEVLALVTRETLRKRRLHRTCAAVAVTAAIIIGLASHLWAPTPLSPEPIPPIASITIPSTPPLVESRQINDQELLDLLEDVPTALMEWPNGDRTLLVLASQSDGK